MKKKFSLISTLKPHFYPKSGFKSRLLSPIFFVAVLLLLIFGQTYGHVGYSHRWITMKALEILYSLDRESWDFLASCDGKCKDIPALVSKSRPSDSQTLSKRLSEEVALVDWYKDLEFVDVEATLVLISHGRDDPHKDETWQDDDKASYIADGKVFTAFNHFIDIKKGSGKFDDYDGYSYYKGSASRDQYQKANEVLEGYWKKKIAKLSGKFVDEGLNYWLNDEYVHVSCYDWYKDCSPSVERYSYPKIKGAYQSVREELKDRYPLAEYKGGEGKGIPYSVFMPLDNMAKYWYDRFYQTEDIKALGPVLHAVQDASVPHHVAGYMGNWHVNYENDVKSKIDDWYKDESIQSQIEELLSVWEDDDPSPPAQLGINDWKKTPGFNWSIENLVTWVALNTYKHYVQTYKQFKDGYKFNESSAKELFILATAMSVHVLRKAEYDIT